MIMDIIERMKIAEDYKRSCIAEDVKSYYGDVDTETMNNIVDKVIRAMDKNDELFEIYWNTIIYICDNKI